MNLMKNSLFGIITVAYIVYLWHHAPIPQDLAYHHFADERTFFGIPNFLNVISNLPFLFVGIIGLMSFKKTSGPKAFTFEFSYERILYFIFFLGVFFVTFGSSYYHWHPDNQRLVWDRLPMTFAFMALFSAIISERLHPKLGLYLLVPLLIFGVFSVFYWIHTENLGHGDLRLYIFVQFYPMIIIPLLLLLYPARYSHVIFLLLSLGAYVLAKIQELADTWIYQLTHHVVDGHAIKHLSAALATYFIIMYLRRRKVIAGE